MRAPSARVTLVGALGSVGIDLRRATAPPAPAEAGDTPDGAGGHTVGGTTGARSERLGGARDGYERGASSVG
jgi:hypothetical protein